MTRLEKITELETLLYVMDDSILNAKRGQKDLSKYFHWILTAEVIRGQIQALNWKFDDEDDLCDVCGSTDIIEVPHMGTNCNKCHPL
jgi:biotin synthase-related radical SAM superfamily protein